MDSFPARTIPLLDIVFDMNDFLPSSAFNDALTDDRHELIRWCRRVQDALPPTQQQISNQLAMSLDIFVRFPTQQESLSRLDEIPLTPMPHLTATKHRYLEACHRIQQETERQYRAFCKGAHSVERLGGGTDRELQAQLAQGLSQWYENTEFKLARVVLANFRSQAQAAVGSETRETVRSLLILRYIRNTNDPIVSQQPEAKHILRRAFAANPSPTDAERDYLARQTGMTYRQVTVWVSLSPLSSHFHLFIHVMYSSRTADLDESPPSLNADANNPPHSPP